MENEKPSNNDHYLTALGNYKNRPVAVGGISPNNKKVEIYEDGEWVNLDDFPFVSSSIFFYSTVSFGEECYLFGK